VLRSKYECLEWQGNKNTEEEQWICVSNDRLFISLLVHSRKCSFSPSTRIFQQFHYCWLTSLFWLCNIHTDITKPETSRVWCSFGSMKGRHFGCITWIFTLQPKVTSFLDHFHFVSLLVQWFGIHDSWAQFEPFNSCSVEVLWTRFTFPGLNTPFAFTL